jgi:hypothetical protein
MVCRIPNIRCGSKGKGIPLKDEGYGGASKDLNDARNRSILAVGTESVSFDSVESEGQFEETQINIQLIGLTNGIVMETSGREARRIDANKVSLSGDEPVFAVVTGFHEVKGSGAIVASHLPSLPVETQRKSKGKKHTLMAMWPADFDPNGAKTSCVTFTRKMKKESIQSLEPVQKNNTKTCMFTTQSLSMSISLMRGNEIKTVGTVSVHFTGAESKPTQMNLPVKVTKYALKKAVSQLKGEKMKKKHAKSKLKPLKPVTFKGDPGRTYRLDEETVLSLLIETSKTDDFQAYDIMVEDVSVGPTNKGAITQQGIFFNSALSTALLDCSDDEGEEEDEDPRPYDEYSQRASDEDSQSDSDEDSQSDLEKNDSDSALADLFNVSIDSYAKDLLATTSPARSLNADTVNNPTKTNADSKSARNAKPGELPPFSPISWVPSPRDIAKKFNFSSIGVVEV